MKIGTAHSSLDVQVAGEEIHVHLSHPLASLDDVQGFTLRLLENLRDVHGEGLDLDAIEAADQAAAPDQLESEPAIEPAEG